MTVRCNATVCPYNYQNFCNRGLTAIDGNGMCSVLWKNGVARTTLQTPYSINNPKNISPYKEDIKIIEGEVKEVVASPNEELDATSAHGRIQEQEDNNTEISSTESA